MKCESQISYTQSSVPNQQGDSLQIEHTDAVLSNASPSKSKQSVLTTPNAMTEVDIVIPKHNLGKSHTYYDYMNIHMEMNENLVKYPQSPAPSARKKRFQTVEPYNKHESTLTYTETKSERNSELPSSQSKISEKMSGESEDEFEDIVSKPMPKLKASSGLKVKRLITSKPKKGDYLSENSDGTHLDIHDLDVYSPVKRINCISSSKSMSLPNPSITPLKNIRTVEVTRQIRNTFSSTGVCKASIGLKASSSVKPLLTNKLVTQPNSSKYIFSLLLSLYMYYLMYLNLDSSPSSPIVFGGPARVGLTRKHKSKPLHPYLQSL
ncbi:hypothetical protein K7432_015182 [Basidiobolus ranarum]|uniref:Uncharacterized protein n=1 Tax=Basidiobolus ranarum TaxID=34480 RepID=A0ABR2VNF2_9FUNG